MEEINFNLRIIFLQKGIGTFTETVKKYFESQGFTVKKNNPNLSEKGIPDFFVSNGKQTFYAEVKTRNDSFQIEQIKWFSQHSKESVLVIEEIPEWDKLETQRYEIVEEIQEYPDMSKRELEQQLEYSRRVIKDYWRVKKDYPEIIEMKKELDRIEKHLNSKSNPLA